VAQRLCFNCFFLVKIFKEGKKGLTNSTMYGKRNLEVINMAKTIFGIRTCANALGISVDRIRRLIHLKIIRPKKEFFPWVKTYRFTKEDQKIIRQHTSMRG
jgi:hypothetical protein